MSTQKPLSVTIDMPVDAHFHGRHPDDPRFRLMPLAFMYYEYAVMMPNLHEKGRPRPIVSAEGITWYRNAIMRAAEDNHFEHFTPIMVLYATHNLSTATLEAAIDAGAEAVKFYPKGGTTNSGNGVVNFFAPEIREIYRVCADRGIPALFHAEAQEDKHGNSLPEMERERAFIPTLCRIVDENPSLRMVVEHLSDHRMARIVETMPRKVGATITTHHLFNTVADNENPHNKCMPTAKQERDRGKLVELALSGNPKFFFGSDNAPHLVAAKERDPPANGVFNTPVSMPLLVELFEQHDAMRRLERFVSANARAFYGLPEAKYQATYMKDNQLHVQESYHGVVPLMAGETLPWRLASTDPVAS